MRIKGSNGEEHNVTPQGQGTYNTVAGSAGLASFLGFNAQNLLGGWNRSNGCAGGAGYNGADMPVTRYEMQMLLELAAKDSRIALLESNIYTDQKIADVYERLNVKINANKDAQEAINREQAVFNGVTTSAVNLLKSQVADLLGIIETVIPQRRICDTGCNCQQ